jgi:thiol-disulfide isomerase/thioredoxin
MWASWSPYTERELPILNQLASTYEGKGVVAIALNRKEPRERANAYLAAFTTQPKVLYVIDETDAFYMSVGGYAMPETVIFDANGNIAWHHRGEISYELIQTEVDKLISN